MHFRTFFVVTVTYMYIHSKAPVLCCKCAINSGCCKCDLCHEQVTLAERVRVSTS